MPSPYVPRAASPFSGTVSVSSHKSNGDRDSTSQRKKPPNGPNPTAAVGILRALDPHHSQLVTTPPPREQSDYIDDPNHQSRPPPEKKERRPFWDRAKDRDREKEKEKEKHREDEKKDKHVHGHIHGHGHVLRSHRDREKEKKEEEAQAELTRMIGAFTIAFPLSDLLTAVSFCICRCKFPVFFRSLFPPTFRLSDSNSVRGLVPCTRSL